MIPTLTYKRSNTAVAINELDVGYGAKIYQGTKHFREDEIHLVCERIGFAYEGETVLDCLNWYHDAVGLDQVDQSFVDHLFEMQNHENRRSIYLLVDTTDEAQKGEWGIKCFGKAVVSKDDAQLYEIDGKNGLCILAISPKGFAQHKELFTSYDGKHPIVTDLPKMKRVLL